MTEPAPQLEIVMPIHNEAATIEDTISEALSAISPIVPAAVIACEDGSTDGTRETLEEIARRLPVRIISQPRRRGYAGAMLAGMRAHRSEYLLTMDSDGQIDPADFRSLWQEVENADLVVGNRAPRRDPFVRRAMSRGFYIPYRAVFGVRMRDPSSSFMLSRRDVIRDLAAFEPHAVEGFWWAFYARAVAHGYRLREIEVNHRVRKAGKTNVYHPSKLVGILGRHLLAMGKVKRDLRRIDQR